MENKLKRQYMNRHGNMISNLRKSYPRKFFRKFKKKNCCAINHISLEQFEEHFKKLVNNDNKITTQVEENQTESVFKELDIPFTGSEVEKGFCGLKRNKATGSGQNYDQI